MFFNLLLLLALLFYILHRNTTFFSCFGQFDVLFHGFNFPKDLPKKGLTSAIVQALVPLLLLTLFYFLVNSIISNLLLPFEECISLTFQIEEKEPEQLYKKHKILMDFSSVSDNIPVTEEKLL